MIWVDGSFNLKTEKIILKHDYVEFHSKHDQKDLTSTVPGHLIKLKSADEDHVVRSKAPVQANY